MNTFACLAVTCLGLMSAEAALVYDPFDYTPVGADLTGQTPNGGLTMWQVMGTSGTGGTDPITIESGSLSVAGLAPSSGNSITYGGLGLTNRIPLGLTINSGTVYYSFAFKVLDLGTLDTLGGFLAGFNNATGNVTNQPTQIGGRVVTRLNGTGFQVGVDKSSGGPVNFVMDPRVFNVGDTIFVVCSYTFNSGSSTDDEARLWVNPDPSTFGLPIAPGTFLSSTAGTDVGGATTQQIQSFLFRQGNAVAVPGALVADELRVDMTWAGVTVPEPSSILCLALSGGGLIARRRRLRS
jgi:PEP-CTERM motif